MTMITTDPASSNRPTARALLVLAVAASVIAQAGCGRSKPAEADASKGPQASNERKVETIEVVRPMKRDIRISVVQPGTIQSYETTPIYSRLSGYVDKYRANIGDRVKKGDVLLDMWIPDLVETSSQKTAAAKRAEVMIDVARSMLKSNEARVEMSLAAVTASEAGVRKSQANYDRWESESRRIKALAAGRVIDEQVRDETYRQFEESVAAREQAVAMVGEAKATRDRSIADRDKAKVDISAAQADLLVAQAEERLARVMVNFGQIKAPYDGVVTQRNVNPGDYLQPGGGGSMSAPIFILEQIDPVRIFVGVPELFSGFIKDDDVASLHIQALPGRSIQGKVLRSGFSLSPGTRTMQTEVDIPNPEGILRPGMYVTVSIALDRQRVFTVPSTAVRFQGSQAFLYLEADGKAHHTPVQVGPSDDRYTEVLRKQRPGQPQGNWAEIDGTEPVLIGNLDATGDNQPIPQAKKP